MTFGIQLIVASSAAVGATAAGWLGRLANKPRSLVREGLVAVLAAAWMVYLYGAPDEMLDESVIVAALVGAGAAIAWNSKYLKF